MITTETKNKQAFNDNNNPLIQNEKDPNEMDGKDLRHPKLDFL